MKPLHIEMAGFGPYRNTQRVEFSNLDELFVISGETGSGKTTIFDGISYALYGKPLGTRGKEMVRCDQSTPEESTLVSFRFEISKPDGQKQVWEIKRSPHFRELNKRGTGYLAPKEYCHLEQIETNGSRFPFTGTTTKINAFIANELLHLSFENFSKILILPQGEFQRFLEEKSIDRGDILEKLFPVEFHKELRNRSSEKVKKIGGQISKQHLLVMSERCRVLKEFSPEEVKALTIEEYNAKVVQSRELKQHAINLSKEREGSCKKAADTARDQMQAARFLHQKIIERESIRKKLSELNEQSEAIALAEKELTLARKALRVTPKYEVLEELKKNKSDLELNAKTAQARYVTAQQIEAELKPKNASLSGARARAEVVLITLEKIHQRILALEHLARVKQMVLNGEEAINNASCDVEKNAAVVTSIRSEIENLDSIQIEKDEFNETLNSLRTRYTTLKQMVSDAEKITSFEQQYLPLRETQEVDESAELDRRIHLHSEKVDALNRSRQRLNANSAGRLAAALTDGEPCPVCGSYDHPEPASQTREDSLLEDIINELESSVVIAQNSVVDYRIVISERQSNFDNLKLNSEEALQRLIQKGFDDPQHFGLELTAVKDAFEKAFQHDRLLAEKLSQRGNLRQTLQDTVTLLDAGQKNLEQHKADFHTKQGEFSALQEKLGGVHDIGVAFDDAKETHESLTKEHAELVARIELISRKWEEVQMELNTVKSRLSATEERIRELSYKAVEADEDLRKSLANNGFQNLEALIFAQRSQKQEQTLEAHVLLWKESRIRLEENLKKIDGTIGEKALPDLDAFALSLSEAETLHTESTEKRASLENVLLHFERDLKNERQLFEAYTVAKKDVNGLLELHKKISGENSKKVKFKDWVLGWWLDHVLIQANVRLEKLSDGRYRFIRQSENQNKSKAAGLDINVIDAQSGQPRDVRTLSGGEKFLASISLALGLADVIQMQSGAVRLDTLFIDEGFGTLSDEYRELVLQALSELGDSRQVGVISHVPEVKNYVPCRVVVKKGHGGSVVMVQR